MTTQQTTQYRILIYDRVLSGVGCGDVPAVTELRVFSCQPETGVQDLPGEVAYAICMARMEYPQHTIMLEVISPLADAETVLYERKDRCVRNALDGLLKFSQELISRFHEGSLPSKNLEIRTGQLVIRQLADPMSFEVDFSGYGIGSPDLLEELINSKTIAKRPRVHEILEQQCGGIAIGSVYFSYLAADGHKKSLLFYRR